MPFADPEKNREYQRNYQRERRSGLTGSQTSNLSRQIRVKTANDVLVLLEETINQVRDADVDTVVKARCVGYLAGITLKAVETANLENRLEALEETLKRKAS